MRIIKISNVRTNCTVRTIEKSTSSILMTRIKLSYVHAYNLMKLT